MNRSNYNQPLVRRWNFRQSWCYIQLIAYPKIIFLYIIQQDNCTNPRQFSTFFSYLSKQFPEPIMPRVCSLYNPYFGRIFLRFGIAFVFSSVTSSPFFFLYGMCSTYPRLINSCCLSLELYALSRHKCCSLILVLSLGLYDGS